MGITKELEQSVRLLANKMGLVVDWSQRDITPYIQDLMNRVVKYQIVTGFIQLGVEAFIALLFWRILKTAKKSVKDDFTRLFLIIVCSAIMSASVLVMFYSISTIAEAIILPEKAFYDTLMLYKK